MSAAPAKPGSPPPVAPEPPRVLTDDPFRAVRLRHAMHLLVPAALRAPRPQSFHRIIVLELKAGVRLSLDLDDDNIGVKHVDLSFTEANKLAEMLNTIRRRAVQRKGWDL